MSGKFHGNEDRWLSIAKADYFSLFVKVWIPFNAWYRNSYDDDREIDCIDKIRKDSNPIRNRFINLWEGTGVESDRFKNYIAELYKQLEATKIENKNSRVTFRELVIEENQKKIENKTYRKVSYYVERFSNGEVKAEIKDQTKTILNYKNNKYDEEHLKIDIYFQKLKGEKKTILLNCFANINPKKPITLLAENNDTKIDIGTIPFKRDSDIICKGVILILYHLRCVLFHGEIVPDESTRKVYEPAFHILEMLIESLR